MNFSCKDAPSPSDNNSADDNAVTSISTTESLDRLFISVPQAPYTHFLPGPPTFRPVFFSDDDGVDAAASAAAAAAHSSLSNTTMNHRKRVHFRDAQVVSLITPGSSMTIEERNEIWYPTQDLNGFKVQARNLSRQLREPAMIAAAEQQRLSSLPETPCSPSSSSCMMEQEDDCGVPTDRCRSQSRGGSLSPPPRSACASLPNIDDIDNCSSSSSSSSSSNNNNNNNNNNDASSINTTTTTTTTIHSSEGCDGVADARGLEHRVCLNRQRNKHLAIRCILKAQSRSRCPDFLARISSKCTQWAKELAVREADRDYCEAYCPQKLAGNPKILQNHCPFAATMMRQFKRCHSGGQAPTTAAAAAVSSQQEQHELPYLLPTRESPKLSSFPVIDSAAATNHWSPPPPSSTCNVTPVEEQQPTQQPTCFLERCVRQKRDGET